MEMTVCNSGLKVITKEQGLTEYRAHRITYNVCPDQYPKLFVWVYKHEGKKLKASRPSRCFHCVCLASSLKANRLRIGCVLRVPRFYNPKLNLTLSLTTLTITLILTLIP